MHVAAVAVHDDRRRDVAEAVIRQAGDVVTPARRTSPSTVVPAPTTTDAEPRPRHAAASASPAGPSPTMATSRSGPCARRHRFAGSGALEGGHPPELLDDVGRAVVRVERAVHRLDVDGDAAGLAPRRRSRRRRRSSAAISRAASQASTPASWRAVASRRRTRGSRGRRRCRPCRSAGRGRARRRRRPCPASGRRRRPSSPAGRPTRSGVPPMNRMSPVKIVGRRGRRPIVSPRVCAGPTSISSTARPADVEVEAPSNVRVGQRSSMPSNWKSPKKLRNRSPTSPGRAVERGQHRRRHLGHLVGGRRRGDDLGAVDELVAVAVIAVGVGVDDGVDRRGRRVGRQRLEHLGGEAQVEQRVDEQRARRRRRSSPALLHPHDPSGCR